MKYDKETFAQLKSELRIDRDALDEECLVQPHNYFHASEGQAYAASRRDRAKHALEVEVANLDKEVREAMIAEGEKITEAQIKAQIMREQDYHRAQQDLLNAALEADNWEALKNAYRQRADMLKSLVQLYQSGYFGEVTGSSERRGARERFDSRRK